jgi:hypothetical protein
MARVVAADATGTTVEEEGNIIVAADVSVITCQVYRGTTTATPTTPAITAAAFLGALTDDDTWTKDTTGRSFEYMVPGAQFSAADVYFILFSVTLTSGEVVKWWHQHSAEMPG